MSIRAYVALGSNLTEPRTQVETALTELQAIAHTHLVMYSRLYRSAPLGPPGQPDYINAVAALDTELSAHALLACLFDIETRHGRTRDALRWGPRTLDLDLLLYGTEESADPHLTLPHPRLHERGFVLYPLCEIAPELIIPGRGSVRELTRQCSDLGLTPLDAVPGE